MTSGSNNSWWQPPETTFADGFTAGGPATDDAAAAADEVEARGDENDDSSSTSSSSSDGEGGRGGDDYYDDDDEGEGEDNEDYEEKRGEGYDDELAGDAWPRRKYVLGHLVLDKKTVKLNPEAPMSVKAPSSLSAAKKFVRKFLKEKREASHNKKLVVDINQIIVHRFKGRRLLNHYMTEQPERFAKPKIYSGKYVYSPVALREIKTKNGSFQIKSELKLSVAKPPKSQKTKQNDSLGAGGATRRRRGLSRRSRNGRSRSRSRPRTNAAAAATYRRRRGVSRTSSCSRRGNNYTCKK